MNLYRPVVFYRLPVVGFHPCLQYVCDLFSFFQVAPKIKARMMEKGTMMVGYQPLGDLPNFFRIVLTNPCLSTEDIDFFLDETARLGEE